LLQPLIRVEMLDGFLERVTTDEPHRIEGPAVGVGPQTVDRDDPRMLQAAGDLGLEEEPLAADGVGGVPVQDLFQRDLAMQLLIQRHEDRTQAALGVRSQDAEPLAIGRDGPDRITGRAVVVVLGRRRAEVGQGAADIGIVDASQALAGRTARRDRGETPFHLTAVLLDVACHQGIDSGSVVGIEVAATNEVVGQGAGLVERPGLERGHELALVNQPVLKRKQAEEQAAVSGEGGHGEAPGRDAAPDPSGHRAGARARGERRIGRIIAEGFVASIPA
jgi:hypothetical protein